MSFQDLLNTEMDFQSLGALARQGFVWWVDELAATLPASWRERLATRPSLVAERQADGRWRYLRDGRVVADARTSRAAASGIALLLPPEDVLVREVELPRMSASDIRRMVAIDIDRLSPLSPDVIYFDTEVVEASGKKGVLLGIVRRDAAARLVVEAEAAGLAPSALVAAGGRVGHLHFDFLPAVREDQGVAPSGRAGRYWRWAVVGLLALNLVALIGRDMAQVADLRRRVELRRPTASAVLELRRRVESEEARRKALAARGEAAEPLRMLQALTEALPTGAWVQHLEWNGKVVRIVGFKSPEIDVPAALRDSGAFVNPRAMTGAAAPAEANGAQPFDITAEARRSAQP